jgi:hypothetical protein
VVTEGSHDLAEEMIPVPAYTDSTKPVGIVPAEIQIKYFPDTSHKHYSLSKLAL